MSHDTDMMLKAMIARHAALEQLVLNMFAVMSAGFQNSEEFQATILDDMRQRFAQAANAAGGKADAEFARAVLQCVEDLARRATANRGDMMQ